MKYLKASILIFIEVIFTKHTKQLTVKYPNHILKYVENMDLIVFLVGKNHNLTFPKKRLFNNTVCTWNTSS